jgi:hypothetical protein
MSESRLQEVRINKILKACADGPKTAAQLAEATSDALRPWDVIPALRKHTSLKITIVGTTEKIPGKRGRPRMLYLVTRTK